eukprot:114141-Rhodomonas_salina.1
MDCCGFSRDNIQCFSHIHCLAWLSETASFEHPPKSQGELDPGIMPNESQSTASPVQKPPGVGTASLR